MASTSSLLKIPLLFSALYCYYIITTSPTVRPRQDERAKAPKESKKMILGTNWAVQTACVYAAILFVITCESVYILATNLPSLPYSNIIASILSNRTSTPLPIFLSSTGTSFMLGYLLVLLGVIIRMTCYRTLGRFFTFDLAIRRQHKLVTTFPYSIVRHPSYIGTSCGMTGILICIVGPGSWLYECGWLGGTGIGSWVAKVFVGAVAVWEVLVVGHLIRRIEWEEKMLREEFGSDWEAWAETVKYKVVPGVW